MTIFKICMLAILGLTALLVIKQWKSDLLPLVRLALTIGLGIAALQLSAPLVTYLRSIMAISALAPYVEILFKALAIAWLTQYAAQICRECGESGAANGVELVGKVEILLLSLPLVGEILGMAERLLDIGGTT